jgi:ABC-type branched-subunit amino acid transport system permease subunit
VGGAQAGAAQAGGVPSFQARAPFIRYVIIGVLLVLFTATRPTGIIDEERQVSRSWENKSKKTA